MSHSRRKSSIASESNIIDTYKLIQKTLAAGNTIEIASAGDSMFPLIKEANICSFKQIIPSELKKGEIVLFAGADYRLVAHRFMGRDVAGNYICKGDANLFPDAPVMEFQLIGKLQIIRRSTYALQADGWICSTWGWIIRYVPLVSRFFRKYLNLTSTKH